MILTSNSNIQFTINISNFIQQRVLSEVKHVHVHLKETAAETHTFRSLRGRKLQLSPRKDGSHPKRKNHI